MGGPREDGARPGYRGLRRLNLAVLPCPPTSKPLRHRLAKQRVDVVIGTTWLQETGAHPVVVAACPRELGLLRRRKIRLALVSDDVQYARAKSVAAARGDAPNYWKNVREAERVLYGHPDVEVVLSISEDDSRAFEEVRSLPSTEMSADFVGHELLKKETSPQRCRRSASCRSGEDDRRPERLGRSPRPGRPERTSSLWAGARTRTGKWCGGCSARRCRPISLSDADGGCDELRNAN